MKIRLLIVLVLFSCLIASCNKTDGTYGVISSDQHTTFATANTSAPMLFNPNNPYDSCGLKHNEYLEYIVDHKSQIDIDNWNNDVSELLVDYATGQGILNESISTFQTKVNQISTDKLKNSNPQNIQEFVDNCIDSQNLRKFMKKNA